MMAVVMMKPTMVLVVMMLEVVVELSSPFFFKDCWPP